MRGHIWHGGYVRQLLIVRSSGVRLYIITQPKTSLHQVTRTNIEVVHATEMIMMQELHGTTITILV